MPMRSRGSKASFGCVSFVGCENRASYEPPGSKRPSPPPREALRRQRTTPPTAPHPRTPTPQAGGRRLPAPRGCRGGRDERVSQRQEDLERVRPEQPPACLERREQLRL